MEKKFFFVLSLSVICVFLALFVLSFNMIHSPFMKTTSHNQTHNMNQNEMIIQQQLDAYNARDLEKFCALYSDDVQVFDYPQNLLKISGKVQFREVYKKVFDSSPELHAAIDKRIVFDNKVIDHEKVTGRSGTAFIEVVVIYEVAEDKIKNVYFIRKSQ